MGCGNASTYLLLLLLLPSIVPLLVVSLAAFFFLFNIGYVYLERETRILGEMIYMSVCLPVSLSLFFLSKIHT
jgi:hypothetical protein